MNGSLTFKRFASSSSNRWLNRQKNDFYTRQSKHEQMKSRAGFKLDEIHKKFSIFKKNQVQNIVDLGFAPGAWTQVALRHSNVKSKILGVDILPCKPPKGANSMQANIFSKSTHKLIYDFFAKGDEIIKDLSERVKKEVTIEGKGDDKIESNEPQESIEAKSGESELEASQSKTSNESSPDSRPEQSPFIINTILSDMLANTSGIKIKDHIQSIDLCDAGLILCVNHLKPNGTFVCKFYTGKEDYLLEYRLRKVFEKVTKYKPKASRDESKECYFVCLKKRQNVDLIDVFKP